MGQYPAVHAGHTNVTLIEAHRLLGHNRDKKAIIELCSSVGIKITDHSWTQRAAYDMASSCDYARSGTMPRGQAIGAVT